MFVNHVNNCQRRHPQDVARLLDFFFFQAEDGIRDLTVTGVQTCALPIWRDLARELIGTLSFSEHFWLLLTAALPSAAQRRVLDATLVAIAEHGMVPSVQAARMTLAAGPEALQGAVAAGLLGCGSVVLGSSDAAGRLFADIAGRDRKSVV